MIFFDNKGLLLLASLSLTACASQYAPLTTSSKYAGGYQDRLLNAAPVSEIDGAEGKTNGQRKSKPLTPMRYLLKYQGTTSDTKERITDYWHQRASELCPNGYKVESHQQTIVHGIVRSPVNGRLENLGTQQPIDKGIIQCLN
jgi:hypothetical protein